MKRKWIMMTGITLLIMVSTGCNTGQEAASTANTELLSLNDTSSPADHSPKREDSTADTSQEEGSSSTDVQQENDSDVTTDTPLELNISNPDAIFIGGKVRSVSQDSFVISRTLVEDFMVIMPEEGSPNEVLVTVRCSDATIYEHWTIQGGGSGITRTDAAFSDIKVGDGLEASGFFNGEEFVAEKVIIELYQ